MANQNFSGINRLKKELHEITYNPPPLCSAGIEDNNIRKWIALIQGPQGSPYEDGIFRLQIYFPESYPYEPPEVKFLTKIYHCNIRDDGSMCLDILDSEWSPALTVSSVLLSICSLLTDCNPYSPVRSAIARLYLSNRALHDTNAQKYTRKYALR